MTSSPSYPFLFSIKHLAKQGEGITHGTLLLQDVDLFNLPQGENKENLQGHSNGSILCIPELRQLSVKSL